MAGIVANLIRARGKGTRKLYADIVLVSGGSADIDTGLGTIEAAVVTVTDAPTSLPTYAADISGISGGTISVINKEQRASQTKVGVGSRNVSIVAVGY